MSIVVKNLTKIYGQQKAVDNISFTVNRGEIVGFLGPNGAGKSTTMKIITGYLAPESGDVTVNGVDVIKDPQSAKKKIGYLPESNALYHDMYIKEYLSFMADVHHLSHKAEAISSVVEQVGLSREKAKKIGQLSKGYKQRVGLAAALIHNPDVLVLDEPTSGLDPNQIIEIRNVIKEQGKDKLVLFSSHILQEVEAICDRIIIINRGKLVADDSLANLQQLSTTNIVRVQFKEALEAEWLRRLADVTVVDRLDQHTWALQTDSPETVRKQLLQLSVEENLNIVSLQSHSQSLEEVFRSLTAGVS